MRKRSISRLDEIQMDFLKNVGKTGMKWMIEFLNVIFRTIKMPKRAEVQSSSCTKKKGDI